MSERPLPMGSAYPEASAKIYQQWWARLGFAGFCGLAALGAMVANRQATRMPKFADQAAAQARLSRMVSDDELPYIESHIANLILGSDEPSLEPQDRQAYGKQLDDLIMSVSSNSVQSGKQAAQAEVSRESADFWDNVRQGSLFISLAGAGGLIVTSPWLGYGAYVSERRRPKFSECRRKVLVVSAGVGSLAFASFVGVGTLAQDADNEAYREVARSELAFDNADYGLKQVDERINRLIEKPEMLRILSLEQRQAYVPETIKLLQTASEDRVNAGWHTARAEHSQMLQRRLDFASKASLVVSLTMGAGLASACFPRRRRGGGSGGGSGGTVNPAPVGPTPDTNLVPA